LRRLRWLWWRPKDYAATIRLNTSSSTTHQKYRLLVAHVVTAIFDIRNFMRPILRSAYGALASLWYRPHNIRSSQKSSRWISTETLHQTHHSLTIHNLTNLLSFFSLPFVPPSFTSGHRKDSSGSLQGSLDFISMLGVWELVIGYGLGFLLLLLLTFLSCQL